MLNDYNFMKLLSYFMRPRIVLIIILLALTTTGWARGAYKWVDGDGTVHYSDRLKSDNAEIINVPVKEPETDADSVPSADDSTGASGQTSPASVDGEKTPQQLAMEKKQRKENCQKARDQYTRNQHLGRMYRTDANGERQYLSDKEREDVIKKSREAVDYWCK